MGDRESGEPGMQVVRTIGLDIAKSVFQIHGVDAAGNVLIRCQIKRRYVLAFFLHQRGWHTLGPCLTAPRRVPAIRESATACPWWRGPPCPNAPVRLRQADRCRRS
jgi:hypothetical protein